MKNQDYLYLDHAASTPMRTSALEKYVEAESFGFANSSGVDINYPGIQKIY